VTSAVVHTLDVAGREDFDLEEVHDHTRLPGQRAAAKAFGGPRALRRVAERTNASITAGSTFRR
jgi:hypothetical protein